MSKIIDGQKLASQVKSKVKAKVKFIKRKGHRPGLATIGVGSDSASKLYIKLKQVACDDVGIYSEHYDLPKSISESELLKLISKLNQRSNINGILVQLPLPKKFDTLKVLSAITAEKDVDGVNPLNIGKLAYGDETFAPATPKGIIYLIEKRAKLKGKHVVIVNHSIVVGKPLALMLLNRHATVTVCNIHTKNLKEQTLKADILVSAVGKPDTITSDMIKRGAIVVDAGISRHGKKIAGDVNFEGVKQKASAITPVPGGVGPLTVAMLLENTVSAACMQYL